MRISILSVVAAVAVVACGDSTGPPPSAAALGPITGFAPNTVSFVRGVVDGYVVRIDDRVAFFEHNDPSSGCPLAPLSTQVNRPADVPSDAVFFETCQGNAYTVEGVLVAGTGSGDLDPLPIYVEQGIVYLDTTPDT
jgi:hypothetical protein